MITAEIKVSGCLIGYVEAVRTEQTRKVKGKNNVEENLYRCKFISIKESQGKTFDVWICRDFNFMVLFLKMFVEINRNEI